MTYLNQMINREPEEKEEGAITEELERKAYDEVNESVAKARLPPETIESAEKELDAMYLLHGHHFASREDSDFFAMLPLSKQQRLDVIQRARQIERES